MSNSQERPIDDRDRLNDSVLRDAVFTVTNAHSEPLFGAQIIYTSSALGGLKGITRDAAVITQSAETPTLEVARVARQVHGTLRIEYLEHVLYDGPAKDLLVSSSGGNYTATLTTTIAAAIDVSGTSSPVAVVITPTAASLSGGLLITWASAGAFLYRVYASTDSSAVFETPVGHTSDTSLLLADVHPGDTVYVNIRAENSLGVVATDATTTALVYTQPALNQGFMRQQMPRSITVSAGGNHTVDLTTLAYPVQFTGDSSSVSTRWNEVGLSLLTIGDSVEAELSGTDVILTVAGGAPVTADLTVCLVRLVREGLCAPVWIPFVAKRATSTAETAYNLGMAWTGNHPDGLAVDPELLVGADAAVDTTWTTGLRNVRQLSYSTVTTGGGLVQATGRADGVPELCVFKGDDGYGAVLLQTDPDLQLSETPFLPAGTIAKVEAGSTWQTLDLSAVLRSQSLVRNLSWPRCLVASSLYDLSTTAPPAAVFYASPVWYGTELFNRAQYPSDISFSLGTVTYRGGLTAPAAGATAPAVSGLYASASENDVVLQWATANSYDTASIDIDIPVFVKRAGGTALQFHARNTLRLDTLLPSTFYTAYLLTDGGATFTTFTTPAAQVSGGVRGRLIDLETYRYDYTIVDDGDDNITSWTDAAGTAHGTLTATLDDVQAISTHAVYVTHTSGRAYPIELITTWEAPPTALSFSRTTETGRALPAAGVSPPLFGYNSYSGTAVRELPYNTYHSGTVTAVAEGILPPGMTGELEDYVSLQFIDSRGATLESTVVLAEPTELALRVAVTAIEGQSPIIYGVRVVAT